MQKTTDQALGRKDWDPVASPCGCKSGGLPLTRVAHTGRSAMQAKGCQPRNLKLKRPMIVKPFSFDFKGIVFWTCAVGAAGNLMLAGSIGLHETFRFCYRRTTSARGKDVFSFRSARAAPAGPATIGSYTRCACASDGLLGWWVGWQDGEWDDGMVSGGWKQTPRLER